MLDLILYMIRLPMNTVIKAVWTMLAMMLAQIRSTSMTRLLVLTDGVVKELVSCRLTVFRMKAYGEQQIKARKESICWIRWKPWIIILEWAWKRISWSRKTELLQLQMHRELLMTGKTWYSPSAGMMMHGFSLTDSLCLIWVVSMRQFPEALILQRESILLPAVWPVMYRPVPCLIFSQDIQRQLGHLTIQSGQQGQSIPLHSITWKEAAPCQTVRSNLTFLYLRNFLLPKQ